MQINRRIGVLESLLEGKFETIYCLQIPTGRGQAGIKVPKIGVLEKQSILIDLDKWKSASNTPQLRYWKPQKGAADPRSSGTIQWSVEGDIWCLTFRDDAKNNIFVIRADMQSCDLVTASGMAAAKDVGEAMMKYQKEKSAQNTV